MPDAAIKSVSASAFTIPTDAPEADGTFAWNSTTLVLVEVNAGGKTGIGYSYTDAAAAAIISGALDEAVVDLDALAIPLAHEAMLRRVRNIGRSGLVATAIAAVDSALWGSERQVAGSAGRVPFSVPRATLFSSMAAEASPPTPSGASRNSLAAGPAREYGGWLGPFP